MMYYDDDEDDGGGDHDVQLRPSAYFISTIRNERCYTTRSDSLTD